VCTTGIDLRVAIKHSRSFNSQHLQLRSCFCVVIIIIFNRSTVAVALCYLCILFLLFFLLIMLFQHNRIKYYARILRVHTVRSNTTSSSLMASLSFSSHHKLNHNRIYIYIYEGMDYNILLVTVDFEASIRKLCSHKLFLQSHHRCLRYM